MSSLSDQVDSSRKDKGLESEIAGRKGKPLEKSIKDLERSKMRKMKQNNKRKVQRSNIRSKINNKQFK